MACSLWTITRTLLLSIQKWGAKKITILWSTGVVVWTTACHQEETAVRASYFLLWRNTSHSPLSQREDDACLCFVLFMCYLFDFSLVICKINSNYWIGFWIKLIDHFLISNMLGQPLQEISGVIIVIAHVPPHTTKFDSEKRPQTAVNRKATSSPRSPPPRPSLHQHTNEPAFGIPPKIFFLANLPLFSPLHLCTPSVVKAQTESSLSLSLSLFFFFAYCGIPHPFFSIFLQVTFEKQKCLALRPPLCFIQRQTKNLCSSLKKPIFRSNWETIPISTIPLVSWSPTRMALLFLFKP